MGRMAIVLAILIAIAVFVVSWHLWSEFWISDSCLDSGGFWDSEAGDCRGVEGFEDRSWPAGMWVILLGFPAVLSVLAASGIFFSCRYIERRKENRNA